MVGIPEPLYDELRQTLQDVEEVSNPEQLRALFATEKLRPLRSRLKIATSPEAQVTLLIGTFADEALRTGENALVLFLQQLADNYDVALERHHQLSTLAESLAAALPTAAGVRKRSSQDTSALYPPRQFRPPVPYSFVDRTDLLKTLPATLDPASVVCIYGAPGVGKTALANKLARQLYEQQPERFPDGVLWSDLFSRKSLQEVLAQVLADYRVERGADSIEQVAQRLLADKRALWVLDGANRHADEQLLAQLLEIRGQCTLVVTSRDSDIVQGTRQELQPLPPAYALALLQSVSGRNIATEEEKQVALDICTRLGYLPLAIRIWADWAGSRAQSRRTWAYLRERLTAVSPLDLRSPFVDAQSREQTVRASFDLSWENLESDALRDAFAAIGVFAGDDWDATAVAAVLAVDPFVAQDLLDELVNKCLLEFGRTGERYSAQTLLRVYAKEKLGQNPTAFWRAAEYFHTLVTEAYQHLQGAEIIEATQQLNLELGNLQGVWRYCAQQPSEEAARIMQGLVTYLWEYLVAGGRFEVIAELLAAAEKVATQFNVAETLAEIVYARASVALVQQSADVAASQLKQAATLFENQNNQKRLGECWIDLAYLYLGTGALGDAEHYTQQALTLAKKTGQPRELGQAHWMSGNILSQRGLVREALAQFEQALTFFQTDNAALWIHITQRELGIHQRLKGEPAAALDPLQQALAFFKAAQRMTNIDFTLLEIGHTYLALNQVAEAEQAFTAVLTNGQHRLNDWLVGAAMCGNAEVALAKGDFARALAWYKQALDKAKQVDAPQKQAVVLRGMGEIFMRQDQLHTAFDYFSQALRSQQVSTNTEETLFAVAYLLVNRPVVQVSEIGDTLKQFVMDDHERAILLVTMAQLVGTQQPALVLEIGELLCTISTPLHELSLPKRLRTGKKLAPLTTVGELLSAILQKTVDFSPKESQQIEQALQKARFWPQQVETQDVAHPARPKAPLVKRSISSKKQKVIRFTSPKKQDVIRFTRTKLWGPGGGTGPKAQAMKRSTSPKKQDVARFASTKRWGAGGGCFPSGTRILLANHQACPIETLQIGDTVLSKHPASSELTKSVIKTLYCGKADAYYLVNHALRLTGTHAIFTDRGWIPVAQLQLGDLIYDWTGQSIEVEKLELIHDTILIYNLELEEVHTFFAEGILVHNPKGAHSH